MKAFQERQLETQKALEELEGLLKEAEGAEAERQLSGLSSDSFAVYWLLKRDGVAKAKDVAEQVGEALGRYPHWQTSEHQEMEVRKVLYKALIDAKADKVTELASWLMTVLKRKPQ